ncbi:MAG TPA: hypothetical protein VHX86_19480 [Tepidisphaeraceae bacterium]|jgi:hypothetical protein|nr:hypothetical protein [Tepidisphaeraceae bacterium]
MPGPAMQELPPQSRISSRIEGGNTTLLIPGNSASSRGCIAGSFSAAAVFGFLTVVCMAQGIFSKNLLWTGGGFFFFILTAWQLLALRILPRTSSTHTQLEITPELLSETTGLANAQRRRQWLRATVADICVEQQSGVPELRVRFNDGQDTVCILSGLDPDELRWVAEQIRLKWKMRAGS